KLADVKRLGEVHLEESTLAIGQRNHILRVLAGLGSRSHSKCGGCFARSYHGCFIAVHETCAVDVVGTVEAMPRGVVLEDLHAAAMAVHVAEAADVHKYVEAKLLAAVERACDLVMASAMTQAEVDDFRALCRCHSPNHAANLAVRMVRVLI